MPPIACEVKELLEDFSDYLINPSRVSVNDLPKIKEIKKLIDALYVEKEGLLFSYPFLDELLEESLSLFQRLRIRDGNHANTPAIPAEKFRDSD